MPESNQDDTISQLDLEWIMAEQEENVWKRKYNLVLILLFVTAAIVSPVPLVTAIVLLYEIGLVSHDQGSWTYSIVQFGYNYYRLLFIFGIFVVIILLAVITFNHAFAKRRIENIRSRIDDLRSNLGSDFEVRLVNINLKYLDQYYLETRIQANKSFYAAMLVSLFGFIIICMSIWMFMRNATSGAVLTLVAGAVTEFISAVFFYMFNKTVLSMAAYHQRLVFTQNIALSLKIMQSMPDSSKSTIAEKILQNLLLDINGHLAGVTDLAPRQAAQTSERDKMPKPTERTT